MIKKYLKRYIPFFKATPYVISGTWRHTGEIGRLLFIGKVVDMNYFQSLFFEEAEVKNLGEQYFWQLNSLVVNNKLSCELILISSTMENAQSNLFKSLNNELFLPTWLNSNAQLPLPINNKSSKSDLRRIKRNNLHHYISSDINEAENFFKNMYIPYITARHAESSIAMQWPKLKGLLQENKAEIIFVMNDQQTIAGMVIDYCDNIPRFWSIGIEGAKREWMDQGAIAACYYFSGLHLSKLGYSQVNFGLTKPFFNDGIFQLKRKWQPTITSASLSGFYLRHHFPQGQFSKFIEAFPFIHQQGDTLHGLVPFDDIPMQTLASKYKVNGLIINGVQCFLSHDSRKSTVASFTSDIPSEQEEQLEAAVHYFFSHNINLRSINHILIYGDENTDLLLKQALIMVGEKLSLNIHWLTLSSSEPLQQQEKSIIDRYMTLKPDLLIELSQQYFYPSEVWHLARKNKIQLLSLGALSAEAFYRCIYQNDLENTTKLIKVLTNKFEKADKIRITCPAGTDISMVMKRTILEKVLAKLKVIPWQSSHVRISQGILENSSKETFLTGQVSFLGIPRSVKGKFCTRTYVYPPHKLGNITDEISCKIEKGYVKELSGNQKILAQINQYSSTSNREVLHFCLGLLPTATFSGSLMEAERVFGSINLGFGQYPQHCDMISPKASIYLDEEAIFIDGKLVAAMTK